MKALQHAKEQALVDLVFYLRKAADSKKSEFLNMQAYFEFLAQCNNIAKEALILPRINGHSALHPMLLTLQPHLVSYSQ